MNLNYQIRLLYTEQTSSKTVDSFSEVQSDSIDTIMARLKTLEQIELLAGEAARTLKEGGYLLAILDSPVNLPEVMAALGKSLNYQWTLCYLLRSQQSIEIADLKIISSFKPVLWFVKGKYQKGKWRGDVIKPDDKRYTHLGEACLARLINDYSKPGEVILEPFPGDDLIGFLAQEMERSYVGVRI